MPVFSASTQLDFPQESVFQYHATRGAIDRLIPPWEAVTIAERTDSLRVGSEVVLVNRQFGISQRWLARHTRLEPNSLFEDTLVRGPFRRWVHEHRFEAIDSHRSRLTDSIQFELPLAPLSHVAMPWVRSKLQAMFRYRHRTTADDLSAMQRLSTITDAMPLTNAKHRPPRIAVTGSSGLIGRRVIEMACVFGWDVVRIVRPGTKLPQGAFPTGVGVAQIESSTDSDRILLEDLDAVIHLSGFGIAEKRWTAEVKKKISDSRMRSTGQLIQFCKSLNQPPRALVSASGVGYFGDAGDRECREDGPPGTGFLADLASDWESAAMAYEADGGRVALSRFAMVLHPRFGALAPLLTPFRLGLGGPMGSGQQYWPWVHIDDAANILLHLAVNPECNGPYHAAAPEPPTNREFARTLAGVLHRPSILPVPSFALRLLLGEMADSLLLASARTTTDRLLASGYAFRFPTLRGALTALLGVSS